MAWGKEWPSKPVKFIDSFHKMPDQPWPSDWPSYKAGDKIVDIEVKQKEYSNLLPTHDPYKNPSAHIYYQCACGAILDPGTRSFAELNNQASKQGWKVRWGANSYQPYCVKCGEDVE